MKTDLLISSLGMNCSSSASEVQFLQQSERFQAIRLIRLRRREKKKPKVTDLLCNLANLSCAPEEHPTPKCAMETDRESRSGADSKSVITSPEADQHLEPNQNRIPFRQSKEKKRAKRASGVPGERHTQKCSRFERKHSVWCRHHLRRRFNTRS